MAVISTVAKFLPIGGSSLSNLADLYRFRATWNATVATIALFEGTVYNIMQPNGLYTQVLVSAKLASLTEFPSHIYSTGHFFRIVESMLSLVTDWKTHMGTLKKSSQWEAIKDLVDGMNSGNDKLEGTFGEEEMSHLQESVNGVFNDDVEIANLVRFYVNLLVLKALYFKVCPSSGKIIKKTCLEKNDHILNGQSVEDLLYQDLSNNPKLKKQYESGLMRRVNLEKYMEDRVIKPFTQTLAKTHSEKGYSLETGLHLPQGSYNMAAKDLLKTYIEPRIKSLRTEIIRIKKKLKQDQKLKAKKAGTGMMEKARKFLAKAKSMPDTLKNGFHRLYLMTMLEQYQGPCTATFEEYTMTMNTLLLEINYEMWQGQTEMSGKKGYKEWVDKTRSLVDNMRSCMTEPVEGVDLVKRAEKEGFGCVMMDAIHDSLQNMGYSPGFTDILTRHVKTVTQHRINTGHKEGAFNTHECAGLRRIRCKNGKCVEKAPECFTGKSASVKSSKKSTTKSDSDSQRDSKARGGSSVSTDSSENSDNESEETSPQDSNDKSGESSQQGSEDKSDDGSKEESEETSQEESDGTATLTDTRDGSSITEVETISSNPSESYTSTFVVQSGGKSMSGTSSLGLSFESTFFGSSYSDSLKWENQRYLFSD